MRTTLDIDDDLLAVFREKARKDKLSIGRLISQTLRRTLNGSSDQSKPTSSTFVYKNGIPVLPSRGEVITYEHVQRLLEEEDY
jgi:hypothetical protein